MKKNIALVVSWCITLGLLVGCFLLLRGFMDQNKRLRDLRADLWRQQVSMRQKHVEIAKQLDGVDEATRRHVVELLIESAEEVDDLRDQHHIGIDDKKLAELKEALEQVLSRKTLTEE